MELHSSPAVATSSSANSNSVMGKKFWNFFRIAYFMMRKGLISKRKLIMDMNLMMRRGKILRKTLGNLMFHHHSRNMAHAGAGAGFGLQEYEFSCSNSPNPVIFHMQPAKRKQYHYFPCINPPADLDQQIKEEEEDISKAVVLVPRNNKDVIIPYSPEYSCNFRFGSTTTTTTPNLTPARERLSPLLSPFSIRISNYSSTEDENETEINKHVDDAAEEFIRRFYEQLRVQSRTQLLQYQEVQYQEMLARGTR